MEFENWGDYFWPGQIDDCMINRLGIHDAGRLHDEERRHSFLRSIELMENRVEIPQTFDLDHLQAIHHHLFQDVYEWAGQLRATELVRPDPNPNRPGHEFVKPENISQAATLLFEQADPELFGALPGPAKVDQLARVYAGVNVVHPFVEGNGRTNRIFLEQLAETSDLAIDWNRMPRQNEVMADAFTAGYEPVAKALKPCIVPRSAGAAFEAARTSAAAFPKPARWATKGTSTRPANEPHRPPRRGPEPGRGHDSGPSR